jgi:hypothetical protein
MGMKPVYAEEVEANYTVTELNNGFSVLTESQTFPGAINMGKYWHSISEARVSATEQGAWTLALILFY